MDINPVYTEGKAPEKGQLLSSDKLIKDLITTLETEIAALDKEETDLSFKIKAKKAQLRKYQKAYADTSTEATLGKEDPNKV